MDVNVLKIDPPNLSWPSWWRKSRSVLVVENDECDLALITRAAEREGFTVVSATGFRAAEAILQQNGKNYVLILIDVILPDGEGWALRRMIADEWPHLRVCMMSGATESFIKLPRGEHVEVLAKSDVYHTFWRQVKERLK